MLKDVNIEQFLSLDNYATEIRKNRRKGAGSTQEFFTPYEIVKMMGDKISDEDWADPDKTFCDPCCGNGQFIIYIIWNRIKHGVDWKRALETCFGVELMKDNIEETQERIINLLKALNIDFIETTAQEIIERNIVCCDFFKWNFEEWREMTEEEIKESKKR